MLTFQCLGFLLFVQLASAAEEIATTNTDASSTLPTPLEEDHKADTSNTNRPYRQQHLEQSAAWLPYKQWPGLDQAEDNIPQYYASAGEDSNAFSNGPTTGGNADAHKDEPAFQDSQRIPYGLQNYGVQKHDLMSNAGHAMRKRSLDSISGVDFYGMRQNFFDGKRYFDSTSRNRLGALTQRFLAKRGKIESTTFGPQSDTKDGSESARERRFDSITGGALSGMHQNYLGKRFDSISGSSSGLNQNYLGKRFDSINSGSLSGMKQNYLGKRFDSINGGAFTGLKQNYLGKRFDSINGGAFTGLNQNYLGKRFDSINGAGTLSGIRQNYLGKRFDSINSDSLSGFHQNYLDKRFDSINSGALSGLHQNYLGKRFDSINTGSLSGLHQNYLGKRFDSIDSDSLSGIHQNYLGKRFDSINGGGAFSGLHQNYLGKRFDSISGSGSLSGLHQNYIGKRLDSINRGSLSGLHQNYLGKRFDSIEGSSLSGFGQNYLNKRLDSISGGSLSGMNQNYLGKRLDSISGSSLSGLHQNHIGKRFDSINSGALSGLHQNYLGKRLDSISSGYLSGINQNHLGRRAQFQTSGRWPSSHNYRQKRHLQDNIADSSSSSASAVLHKRQFDSINGYSPLTAMMQNHMSDKLRTDRRSWPLYLSQQTYRSTRGAPTEMASYHDHGASSSGSATVEDKTSSNSDNTADSAQQHNSQQNLEVKSEEIKPDSP